MLPVSPVPTLDGTLNGALPSATPTLSTTGVLPVLPTALPPVGSVLPSPTPSLPGLGTLLPSPAPSTAPSTPAPGQPPAGATPVPAPAAASPAIAFDGASRPVAARTEPPAGVTVPSFIPLPPGPTGTALALALMVLPMLAVVWLLVLVRTLQKSGEWRGTALRLAIASELGVRPRELAGMPVAALRSLREQLAFDQVTHVLNRPAGLAALEREVAHARRHRLALSIAFVDVDGLKAVNDSRGHAAGDALLRSAGALLTGGLRSEDLVFRFGGDEFVCLLPGTGEAEAEAVMTRLREEAVRRSCGFGFGIGELRPGDDEVALLGRADDRLYDARQARSGAGRPPGPKVPVADRLGPRRRR